jgi:hypothetical protein
VTLVTDEVCPVCQADFERYRRNEQKTSCDTSSARVQHRCCARAVRFNRPRTCSSPCDPANRCPRVLSYRSCAASRHYAAAHKQYALWRPTLLLPTSGAGQFCKCANHSAGSPPRCVPVHRGYRWSPTVCLSQGTHLHLRWESPSLRRAKHRTSYLIFAANYSISIKPVANSPSIRVCPGAALSR